jgi:hypothetical protein
MWYAWRQPCGIARWLPGALRGVHRAAPGHAARVWGLAWGMAGRMAEGQRGVNSIAHSGENLVRPYRYAVRPTRS